MKKQKTEKFKTNKGITLIALVITIIVMLILVSVTISMAINGGIFDYAKKAVDDTKNAIAYEQELADGRINIGGVWYDSIQDYVAGKPSTTSEGLILKATPREESGVKYIDLEIQVDGVKPIEEYALDYAKYQMQHFIKSNVCHDKTLEELEGILKDLNGNHNGVIGDDDVVIGDKEKEEVITQATQIIYNMADMHIELPYEESLRVVYFYMTNQSNSDALEGLMAMLYLDLMYCYFGDIMGIQPAYDGATIEQQILQLLKFEGTFDELLTTAGLNRADLELEASDMGITWGMYLKAMAMTFDDIADLANVNVTVSNGETFVMSAIEIYAYTVPENGTYTFTAELQDGSGRKGETTVVVGEEVTNPYDENNWEMAWTYSATDGWSDMIAKGTTLDSDAKIVAKFYKTGRNIKPVMHPLIAVDLAEGPEYAVVIEGTGNMGKLGVAGTNDIYAYSKNSLSGALAGAITDINMIYTSYVTEAYVSDGITNIGSFAFRDFTSLKKIYLPSTIKTIDDYAFAYCASLENQQIKSNIESIGEYAFTYCTGFTDIQIPSSVSYIGKNAFSQCSQLKNINMQDLSINKIEVGVFEDCIALESVSLPSSVTIIGRAAFIGCESLTNITIPNNVTEIGTRAFSRTGLTSITIPSKVISIGEEAFSQSNIINVVIPTSVETIGEGAFSSCAQLTDVNISSRKITRIEPNTFRNCEKLATITIPEGVTYVDVGAFSECPNLKSIYFPTTLTQAVGQFILVRSDLILYVPNVTVQQIVENGTAGCNNIIIK